MSRLRRIHEPSPGVRAALDDGYPGHVYIQVGWGDSDHVTPTEARELAEYLIKLADEAEAVGNGSQQEGE